MTNNAVRAVVITGKYTVRASPREKRNMWHKMAKTSTLLDSGATHNFIDKQAVSTLKLGMQLLPRPLTVQNIDGTINQEGQIEKYCDLWVCQGNKRNKQQFYVANLG